MAAGAFMMLELRYRNTRLGQASDGLKGPVFHSAARLNPQFEKRGRDGEDAYIISKDKRFVCVMDGVGGWIGRLVDTGKLTKELAILIPKHRQHGKYSNLTELFQNAISEVNSNGSTTCVMAELDDTISKNGN